MAINPYPIEKPVAVDRLLAKLILIQFGRCLERIAAYIYLLFSHNVTVPFLSLPPYIEENCQPISKGERWKKFFSALFFVIVTSLQ